MNQSRSLDTITTQFMTNSQLKQLSPNDRKFILSQFKKLYSQQMSKVAAQLTRRTNVKNNKNQIQQKDQLQIKAKHNSLLKKMEQHDQKRQKVFHKKVNHFKLLDQNWKIKLEQIQRKKKQQYRASLQKAAKYRKQVQNFWTQNKNKHKSITAGDHNVPVIQNEGYFSIKSQVHTTSNKNLKPYSQNFYQSKRKTQSKNQLPNTNKTLLPVILKKGHYLKKTQKKSSKDQQIPLSQSFHKFTDGKSIQQHIEKSKNIHTQKEQFALKKALEKMKDIQLKRKRCRQNRQKNIKQAKLKRSIRQQTIAQVQKSKRQQQQDIYSKQKRIEKKQVQNGSLSRSRSRREESISLSESIVKHRRAKQQLQQQRFTERGQILIQNIMKQKKGKMMRLVKQTINKIKLQALKQV